MPGINILIEGIDLAGKSTLARNLPGCIEELGFTVRQSRNSLSSNNPIAAIADNIRREPEAGTLETGALFLASHLWDARNFLPVPYGTAHLQDSCWVRTLAHHTLQRTPDIPAVLRKAANAFPKFDIAFFLTADISVRQERLHQRETEAPGSNDDGDRLVITDPQRFMKLDDQLRKLCNEFFPSKCIDTTTLSKDEVLSVAVDHLSRLIGVKDWSVDNAL